MPSISFRSKLLYLCLCVCGYIILYLHIWYPSVFTQIKLTIKSVLCSLCYVIMAFHACINKEIK